MLSIFVKLLNSKKAFVDFQKNEGKI